MGTLEDFEKLDIRVGRILEAEDFPEARKPACKLTIGFGPGIGLKQSSVQVTGLYTKEELRGRLVPGVVNFPPRRIGPFLSEVLTLGVPGARGRAVPIAPDPKGAVLGGRLF